MAHILDTKAADFDPSLFHDRYEEAVVAMIKSKQAGLAAPKGKPAADKGNVIDLMEALKRSIGAAPKPKDVLKVKRTRKKAEGQREMLLPISGTRPAKASAKTADTSKIPAKGPAHRKTA